MSELQPQLARDIAAGLAAIEGAAPAAAGPLWGAMHKLLLKAKVDPTAIMRVVGARDIVGLTRMVAQVRGEPMEPATGNDAPTEIHKPVEQAVMQDALRAFRKRMKLSQLDAESKLGVGPMSSGSDQRIQAMEPPREYPPEVWEALARAGKLRREGRGFYSFVEQPGKTSW